VFLTPAQQKEFGKKCDEWRSALWKREYIQRPQPFPGVRELFQALLARGVRIALASSSKGDELEEYKRRLRIADLIDADTSKDDADRSKPHPDIFAAALAKAGGDKEHAVVVGDTPWDAIAAKRLGVRIAGVLCGGFDEQDLRRAGCFAVFRDPDDLRRSLDAWAPGSRR
jgi:HAD superfamily hydrolase (TIGR01509 family)